MQSITNIQDKMDGIAQQYQVHHQAFASSHHLDVLKDSINGLTKGEHQDLVFVAMEHDHASFMLFLIEMHDKKYLDPFRCAFAIRHAAETHKYECLHSLLLHFMKRDLAHTLALAEEFGLVESVVNSDEYASNPDIDRDIALFVFVGDGNIQMIKTLLNSAHPPRTDSQAALWDAASHGHLDIIKLLLDTPNPPRVDYTAFWAAADNRHKDVMKFLLNFMHP